MAELLQIEQAVVEYRLPVASRRAVDGVSLTVAAGEVVGLVGESGCGKSSLARAILGLTPLSSGSIRLDGRELRPLGARARKAEDLRVQMVFQDPYSSLNPRRTIGRQLLDALRAGGEPASRARVAEFLEMVGLDPASAGRFAHQFSGGQRQRIALARALAARPKLVVADEPVSALDASTRAQIAELIVDTARAGGAGVLMISHDLSGLRLIADRIAVMYRGRIVEFGPTEAIWGSARHPYTSALIQAIPQLGYDSPLPRISQVDYQLNSRELVLVGEGHLVAADALRQVHQ